VTFSAARHQIFGIFKINLCSEFRPRTYLLLSPRALLAFGCAGHEYRAVSDLLYVCETGCALGEIFSFMSGLYFRASWPMRKRSPRPQWACGLARYYACGGLVAPERLLTLSSCDRSRAVLWILRIRSIVNLSSETHKIFQINWLAAIILLAASRPTSNEPLLEVFGRKLLFPAEFIGRGDMSRGGLMLRCARTGAQLTYYGSQRDLRGTRPPKLDRWLCCSG